MTHSFTPTSQSAPNTFSFMGAQGEPGASEPHSLCAVWVFARTGSGNIGSIHRHEREHTHQYEREHGSGGEGVRERFGEFRR